MQLHGRLATRRKSCQPASQTVESRPSFYLVVALANARAPRREVGNALRGPWRDGARRAINRRSRLAEIEANPGERSFDGIVDLGAAAMVAVWKGSGSWRRSSIARDGLHRQVLSPGAGR